MTKIKTIIVDDHKLFRKGLSLILNSMKNIEVISEASDGSEFLEKINNIKPDLVLMDIKMPKLDGITATKQALNKYPDLKVIVLSMHNDADYYTRMLDAGVKAFVMKNSDPEELKQAIDLVIEGKNFYSQEILLSMVKNFQDEMKSDTIKLSQRESEVLKYICHGYSNNQIAEKMYLSPRTIETHRANLLSKTGTKNSIQLVVYAIKNKLYNI